MLAGLARWIGFLTMTVAIVGGLVLTAGFFWFASTIPNEDAQLGQYEIAYEQGAPQALLDALKSNQVVPYFWQTGGHYVPECHDWRAYIYPATEFKGTRWYCYAIVKNPPLFKTHTVLSYHKFLDELDQLKWTGPSSPSN